MLTLNDYRNMNHELLKGSPIDLIYLELFTGDRKILPRGTWASDINVILIIRYALEVKLQLAEDEIPKVSRKIIAEQKLWDALNRFKSVPKLIRFVYPDQFNEFDFSRVPVNYWDDIEKIRKRLEYLLSVNHYAVNEIPKVITYDQLVEWGLSNPLKRHNDSPYALIDSLYPGKFNPYQFRKIPQRSVNDKEQLKDQFLNMLAKEKIEFLDVPLYVTQKLLIKHRFSGALKYYQNSPSVFIIALFPNQFDIRQFNKTNGFWKNSHNVRKAISSLIKQNNIPHKKIPLYVTKQLLMDYKLGGLLDQYSGSPIKIINEVYPNEFCITEFQRVPNRHWYKKDNRIAALRSYCKRYGINRSDLPNLTRAYFKKYFPRFVSVVDRHYESKFYLWIIEAFAEYSFTPEEFHLHIGIDGKYCDSKEELIIHNYLVSSLKYAKIIKERVYFANTTENESYIPDWVIEQDGRRFIIEYFGLYQSTRLPEYTKKVYRKIRYYNSLSDYVFISIMPSDFRGKGFRSISKLLKKHGLFVKDINKTAPD